MMEIVLRIVIHLDSLPVTVLIPDSKLNGLPHQSFMDDFASRTILPVS